MSLSANRRPLRRDMRWRETPADPRKTLIRTPIIFDSQRN
jgi:hypothetical protein